MSRRHPVGRTSTPQLRDAWPTERQGYSDQRTIAYVAVPCGPEPQTRSKAWGIRLEERFGSLMAGIAGIWMVHTTLSNFSGLGTLGLPPRGPMEFCAIGILIWLHAKWRRASRLC